MGGDDGKESPENQHVSARRATLTSEENKTSAVAAAAMKSVICVIDFDETLFPTTQFLKGFETFPFLINEKTGHAEMEDFPCPASTDTLFFLQLAYELEMLFSTAFIVADHVYIVTNSSIGWIDGIIQHYMPSLQQTLMTIPRIYCRDSYGQYAQGEDSMSTIKSHAIFDILRWHEPTHIIGVGDQYADWYSLFDMCEPLDMSTYFLKMPHVPIMCPEKFLDTIRIVRNTLAVVLDSEGGGPHSFIVIDEPKRKEKDGEYRGPEPIL